MASGFAVPGDAMTLANASIKAATYDATGAFPLAAVDSGATALARTGADSDTLETLSDQIDGVYTGGNITGNLSGSVGSVTGAVGSVTAEINANVTKIEGATTVDGLSITNLFKWILSGVARSFTGNSTARTKAFKDGSNNPLFTHTYTDDGNNSRTQS